MAALAEIPEGSYAGAGAVARDIGAPQNYLGKLLQTLARSGLVRSQKGLGGGFCLARDPEEISLFDVVEPIEHVSRWNRCFLRHGRCSGAMPCAVHHRWARVRDSYLEFLKTTSVADLAPGESKRRRGRGAHRPLPAQRDAG